MKHQRTSIPHTVEWMSFLFGLAGGVATTATAAVGKGATPFVILVGLISTLVYWRIIRGLSVAGLAYRQRMMRRRSRAQVDQKNPTRPTAEDEGLPNSR